MASFIPCTTWRHTSQCFGSVLHPKCLAPDTAVNISMKINLNIYLRHGYFNTLQVLNNRIFVRTKGVVRSLLENNGIFKVCIYVMFLICCVCISRVFRISKWKRIPFLCHCLWSCALGRCRPSERTPRHWHGHRHVDEFVVVCKRTLRMH